jgi:hypothetical protein
VYGCLWALLIFLGGVEYLGAGSNGAKVGEWGRARWLSRRRAADADRAGPANKEFRTARAAMLPRDTIL